MLVDSHCHLDFPDFAGEHDALIARAKAAGIGLMVSIGTRVHKIAWSMSANCSNLSLFEMWN